jgi:RNA polymerase sigma factor (sigma-70 family)
MEKKKWDQLVAGCIKDDRCSQKGLYKAYYGSAMRICLRYANNRDDAAKIMNEGFLQVFARIAAFKNEEFLRAFISSVMVTTSVRYYLSSLNNAAAWDDPAEAQFLLANETTVYEEQDHFDIMGVLGQLPLACRIIFNLFVIDGFSHHEIALSLNISPADSQTYLFKARNKLREILFGEAVTAI